MVLNFNTRNFLNGIFIFGISALFSCDKEILVKCTGCTTEEPTTALLKIKLEPYKRMLKTPLIEIFKGNLEDSVSIAKYSTWLDFSVYEVNVNQKYTVTGTYYANSGKKFVVIDSTIPEVVYEPRKCDKPCYYIFDTAINLELKYSK